MKLRVLILSLLILIMSVGSVFAADIHFLFQPVYHKTLNVINSPVGQNLLFVSDILGSGKEQHFIISKDNSTKYINDYNLVVSQDNQVINTFKITGRGNWYIAYLRNNDTPDLIHFLIDGSGGFLNDFKIIGKTDNGTIDILYDSDISEVVRLIGNQITLDLFKSKLYLRGTDGLIKIYWDGNHFKSEHK